MESSSGKIVNCETSISFWDDDGTDSYEEYIFPVAVEKLSKYEMWGEFWTCSDVPIEGNWQVIFPITEE